ncbi:hypothetical protein DB346_10910 [Verrucomicrobia bacterium LW23]|nr:hypothetical protein DB346_10910 [Verrucomicrobia bacterium LW23]
MTNHAKPTLAAEAHLRDAADALASSAAEADVTSERRAYRRRFVWLVGSVPAISVRTLCNLFLGTACALAQSPAPAAAPAKPKGEDIIENLHMVTPDAPWWYWALIISSVVVLLIPLLYVLRNMYRKKMLPFQTQPPLPEEDALAKLAAIRHLVDEGAVRDFVREASDILRHYIEARFSLRAPRLSTEEFLYEAEQSPHLDEGHRARLAEFLFRCDRVKFGLGDMDTERMETLYIAAEQFIRSTATPKTPPVEGQGQGQGAGTGASAPSAPAQPAEAEPAAKAEVSEKEEVVS